MDHERYPYFAEPSVRRARAERAARLRDAATHAMGAGWSATRRVFAALFQGANLRPQRLKQPSRP
jgi:hypothetical protein